MILLLKASNLSLLFAKQLYLTLSWEETSSESTSSSRTSAMKVPGGINASSLSDSSLALLYDGGGGVRSFEALGGRYGGGGS